MAGRSMNEALVQLTSSLHGGGRPPQLLPYVLVWVPCEQTSINGIENLGSLLHTGLHNAESYSSTWQEGWKALASGAAAAASWTRLGRGRRART